MRSVEQIFCRKCVQMNGYFPGLPRSVQVNASPSIVMDVLKGQAIRIETAQGLGQ